MVSLHRRHGEIKTPTGGGVCIFGGKSCRASTAAPFASRAGGHGDEKET
jgi:hypothetical protein